MPDKKYLLKNSQKSMSEFQELSIKPEVTAQEEKMENSMISCKKEDLLLHQTQSTLLIDY